MRKQLEKIQIFKSLHIPGQPMILNNIWDADSATSAAEGKAQCLGTSSWAVAAANGYEDNEQIPFALMLDNLDRICDSVDVPVSCDMEAGYAKDLEGLFQNVQQVIEAGAVGINIEDQVISENRIQDLGVQCKRLETARHAAQALSIPLFINARTDIFFQMHSNEHNHELADEVLARAQAYKDKGADGIFVPGLLSFELIEYICAKSPLPVNIMIPDDSVSVDDFIESGIARISFGPKPYLDALRAPTNFRNKVARL